MLHPVASCSLSDQRVSDASQDPLSAGLKSQREGTKKGHRQENKILGTDNNNNNNNFPLGLNKVF